MQRRIPISQTRPRHRDLAFPKVGIPAFEKAYLVARSRPSQRPAPKPPDPTMNLSDPTVSLTPPVFQKRYPFPTANHPSSTQKEEKKAKKPPGSPSHPHPPPHLTGTSPPSHGPSSPPPSLPAIPLNPPTHTSRKGGVALNRPRVAVNAALVPKWEPCTPAGQHPRPLPPKIEKKAAPDGGWKALSCLYLVHTRRLFRSRVISPYTARGHACHPATNTGAEYAKGNR